MPRKICFRSPPSRALVCPEQLPPPGYLPAGGERLPRCSSAAPPSPPAGDLPLRNLRMPPWLAPVPSSPDRRGTLCVVVLCIFLFSLSYASPAAALAPIIYCAGSTPGTPGGIPGTILPLVVFTDIFEELDNVEFADRPRLETFEPLVLWPTPP